MENNAAKPGRDEITDNDRRLARICLNCPVCNYARRKQHGAVYWFVTKIESKYCPNCKAYEKVYGRKAHEPLPGRS